MDSLDSMQDHFERYHADEGGAGHAAAHAHEELIERSHVSPHRIRKINGNWSSESTLRSDRSNCKKQDHATAETDRQVGKRVEEIAAKDGGTAVHIGLGWLSQKER